MFIFDRMFVEFYKIMLGIENQELSRSSAGTLRNVDSLKSMALEVTVRVLAGEMHKRPVGERIEWVYRGGQE